MMEVINRITLNDGTELDGCQCGYSEKVLWCFLSNVSFGQAYELFHDLTKSNKIIFDIIDDYQIVRTTYSGLERLTNICQREFTIDLSLEGSNITIEKEVISREVDSEDATIYNPDPNES